MADRTFNDVKGLGSFLRELHIVFAPNGTSDPTYTTLQTPGVTSITRTGVGAFLVTLRDTYCQFRNGRADLLKSTATPNWAQIGTVANVGTSSPVTVVVRTVDGSGAGVDEAAAATTLVSLILTFNDVNGII